MDVSQWFLCRFMFRSALKCNFQLEECKQKTARCTQSRWGIGVEFRNNSPIPWNDHIFAPENVGIPSVSFRDGLYFHGRLLLVSGSVTCPLFQSFFPPLILSAQTCQMIAGSCCGCRRWYRQTDSGHLSLLWCMWLLVMQPIIYTVYILSFPACGVAILGESRTGRLRWRRQNKTFPVAQLLSKVSQTGLQFYEILLLFYSQKKSSPLALQLA